MSALPAGLAILLATLLTATGWAAPAPPVQPTLGSPTPFAASTSDGSAVANFSASLNRLVELLGVAGSALLALVWARVAISWFSHDVTKKVQAKERARDALVGSLLFTAAITGLLWGLARWVLTGT